MNNSFIIDIILGILVLVATVTLILNFRKRKSINIRNASLTVEELESHARRMAIDHSVSLKKNLHNWPIKRLNENYAMILNLYKELNKDTLLKKSVPPSAEWLLDNFYVIEEQVKMMRKDMNKKSYRELPVLKKGHLKGYSRVLAIAIEYVSQVDGQVDESTLIRYLDAYQSHSILFDREIRMIPTMLRLALIENMRSVSETLTETHSAWNQADDLIETWMEDENTSVDKMIKNIENTMGNQYDSNASFIEHLFFRLRRSGKSYSGILKYMDTNLEKVGTSIEQIAQKEHISQAVNTVSMGNCVMALKYVSSMDWLDLFEKTSFVEAILRKDPSGIYEKMDIESRGHYLRSTETLAKIYGVSERHIAGEVLKLATEAYLKMKNQKQLDPLEQRKIHVGYYLVDKGKKNLEDLQDDKMPFYWTLVESIKRHPLRAYIGSILIATTAIITGALMYLAGHLMSSQLLVTILTGLIIFIPSSEIAITLVNWLVGKIVRPSVFPRLKFKDGIPPEYKTMVVVPTLLSDVHRVDVLLENLESNYLSNRIDNLYFALIGAYSDSEGPNTRIDERILRHTSEGIKILNETYAKGQEDIFYFYHRMSQFNETDNQWTGWERKRGALMEFNELLLGSEETSFRHYSENAMPSGAIKYIITLDSDTQLPIGMAKKMIGTMAHPLNTPIINSERGVVVDGYGLIQPRVSFDVESANKSLFSKIFTGQEGVDPYASAISDVYQDIFGEGIFTGKGIYDLSVFHQVLKNAVPDRAVLSHDLLEGSYVRAALVSDLELIDAYPTKYNSYIARLHRWIRGDWQLIPWLRKSILNRSGEKIRNPLSAISKWKIADNLRRSLVAPAVMLLLISGIGFLPGNSLVWTIFGLLPLGASLFLQSISSIFKKTDWVKRHLIGFFGLKASLFQFILGLMFLPYQSMRILNAIGVTLYRLLISKKNMLEWVTSDDSDKNQKNSLGAYLKAMWLGALMGVPMIILGIFHKPQDWLIGLCFFVIWVISPFVAYYVSLDEIEKKELLEPDEEIILKQFARKTWHYFDTFANKGNNFLAPDNYQEDPNRGVAYRTSPTNIGLGLLATLSAKDMGYIGNIEMLSTLSETVRTIEKLPKWYGHLFNWYDTKSLNPLYPRYISTVDSGNFIGYLITLIEGLKSNLSGPIIRRADIEGILDTIRCGEGEIPKAFQELMMSENITPLAWSQALSIAVEAMHVNNDPKNIWKQKTLSMTVAYVAEIEKLMPYLSMLSDSPVDQNLESILALISKVPSLDKMQEYNQAILEDLEPLRDTMHQAWVEAFEEKVIESSEYIKAYLNETDQLMEQLKWISDNTQFGVLYSEKRHLFSIGFNLEDNRLTNSFYDLLASESRQASYIAIARGEVPSKHWYMLGRSMTVVDRFKGLISWSGTMFEYLMPLLIMKTYKNTLLDETYSFVIKSQMKYGKQRNMPWGTSESVYNLLDTHLDYQYKAIGVPWLGLKRGLGEDAVTAPYATFMALMVAPREAFDNLILLKSEGLEGTYGFFDAADYTPERLGNTETKKVLKSYMAHHQGMSLLAINNYLNRNVMQDRFFANPSMSAAKLLLQERVPLHVIFTKENKEKIMPFKEYVIKDQGSYRRFTEPNPVLPKAHILSNGNYTVLVTDKGNGYSRTKSDAVTRWRKDASYGMFFYIKNVETGAKWSSTYAPLGVKPDFYEVVFTPDKALYKRKDGLVETSTEIIVASGDNVEIRRIKLKNSGKSEVQLELTSYYELVLAPHKSDLAHPTFSNLFIETEFDAKYNALIANRRPRDSKEKGLWVAQMPVAEDPSTERIRYETDRMLFLGRGRTVANPVMVERDKQMANTTGTVLDPILSIQMRVRIQAEQSTRISFVTMIADSKEELYVLLEKYSNIETCDASFWLAVSRSQVETRYLNIKAAEMELYQNMISDIVFLSPIRKNYASSIALNKKGQSSLWPYGISGDHPIILIVIDKAESVDVLNEALKAHEYWRLKDLRVDLVIVVKEENSYFNPLATLVNEIVFSGHTTDGIRLSNDIFVLNEKNLAENDFYLLSAVSSLIFKGNGMSMFEQWTTEEPVNMATLRSKVFQKRMDEPAYIRKTVVSDNGIGGFSDEGNSYLIQLENEQVTPAPWTNVIANQAFGFIVTESGGGFTWSGNSRENKLTPWSNDPVSDVPGEVFYLSDASLEVWTMTPQPVRETSPYTIEHGFGYTSFGHVSHGLSQKMTQFVPVKGNVKISLISIENLTPDPKAITLTHYVKPVMGVQPSDTGMHIRTSLGENGALLIENPFNQTYAGEVIYMNTSITEKTVTGSKTDFFGSSDIRCPEALKNTSLSGTVGIGYVPCAAMQIEKTIQPGETAVLTFVIGTASNIADATRDSLAFADVESAKSALDEVKSFWNNKLSSVQIRTPNRAFDIMMNGWLMYQVISCRLWARSAFYQSGGAFGFRDQLQDSLSIMNIWPELAREQIAKHAAHQFVEGDVLHWWHEPELKGTRTRISDDYLWLPFVTAIYIDRTQDEGFLDLVAPFLEAEILEPHEDERYCSPRISEESGSIYEHCIRAIHNGLKFGERGLPLMGSGDWNDGMNRVGVEGKGESVWLGWFLYTTLQKFIPICASRQDDEHVTQFTNVSKKLLEAIEQNGWDGNWYRRAYFDNGEPLGAAQNYECRIDSLAQSWSVISGGAQPDRINMAMHALEDHLVDQEHGLIKLLTPPFVDGTLEPGYIKGYVPGVRENGGQYTHAVAWVIEAYSLMGDGDKAMSMFDLVNPINHSRTPTERAIYKVEPYVMAADVYSAYPHEGRGGWTWYTGSASWMYEVGLTNLLGITRKGDQLMINPCIPKYWTEFSLSYGFKETVYIINVSSPNNISKGNTKITLDGHRLESMAIPLINDATEHHIDIELE